MGGERKDKGSESMGGRQDFLPSDNEEEEFFSLKLVYNKLMCLSMWHQRKADGTF